MAKMPEKTFGSDTPQRQDYKKTAGKSTLVTTAKNGKALNSSSKNIFQMGRGAK